jgi:hypothetical protein
MRRRNNDLGRSHLAGVPRTDGPGYAAGSRSDGLAQPI